MKRLISTIVCDIRLQVRNGFYYAAAFVAVCWMLALSRIPPDRLTLWMPVFILSNLLINTFYFMAGLVLLEKTEGTLMAQSVTPLRSWEYLVSKVLTLALLSVCESFVIVVFGYGVAFGPIVFVLGVVSSAAFFALAGFLVVIRYDSINEFLFPSFLFTLLFVPPFLSYFGLIGTRLIYLHPIQGSLLLTQAAFERIESWQWLYSVLYSILWIGATLFFSRRMFERFVIAAEGNERMKS
jgi:fluoroquinolone transport system permease protein